MVKFRVVDCDGHVQEPDQMWSDYLEPRYHDLAPRVFRDSMGYTRYTIGGRVQPRTGTATLGPDPRPSRPGGYDPKARLADMDSEGIDVSVIFPGTALNLAAIPDVEIYAALCRAYNDWLGDFCRTDPERLVGVAIVPQTSIHGMLEEARRSVETLRFKGVFLRPNPIGGRTLEDPYFEPLWSFLEEMDVPLTLHEGTTQNVPQAGLDRYENFLFRHVISHPHEQMMACLSLICGGVLERHPRLRVAFLESGCGWIGFWLERMDSHMVHWEHASAKLPLKPSEYWARQCFISADPDEKMIPPMIMAVGDETIMYATDYPHPDGIWPGVVAELAERKDLSEASKGKILGENAVRLFGLDGA